MSNTPEFIDTYSDDLIYLMEFRDSYLTHPLKSLADKFLFEASVSRFFCVFMIGAIESMLEYWKAKDTKKILEPYFSEGSNEKRITALIDSFKNNGIEADERVLRQYLAIKYIRNTIVHSKWNENQKDFIIEQGFPIDTRKLTEEHLQKMYNVYNQMVNYIILIPLMEHFKYDQLVGLNKLDYYYKLPSYNKYFTKRQFAFFLWRNLEKINILINEKKGITQSMIEEVVFDWNLYKEINLINYIDFGKLDKCITFLQKLVDKKIYSDVYIGYIDFEKIRSIESMNINLLDGLNKILKLDKKDIPQFIDAIVLGKRCYERMINKSVISLFKKILNSELSIPNYNFESELKLAEKIFKLGRLYYDYAERR